MRPFICRALAAPIKGAALLLMVLGWVLAMLGEGLALLAKWISDQGEPTCLHPPKGRP